MADSGRIQISVQLGQAVQSLQKLSGSLEDVDRSASKTNQKLDGIRQILGHANTSTRQTRDSVRELVAAYERQTQVLNALVSSQQRVNNVQKAAKTQMDGLAGSVMSVLPAIVSLASAWRIFQTTLGRSVEIDSITKTFYAIQGSMGGAAIEMTYVRSEAQRLGLDFFALAQSFKGFSAATKFANFDLATTKDMFSSVAESASVLGLSGDKTKLILMALEQMVSKGVVSMEELRRQLGDSLPGAFELGAKAMNMGLAEFNKFVASGKLMSEEFLPKFTKTLRETYATAENVGLAMKTPRAEIEKLMNALVFAQDTFARVGFLDTVVAGVRELTATLQSTDMQKSIAELGRMFGILVNAGLEVVQFGVAYGTQIVSLAALIGALTLAHKAYWVVLNLLTMNWQKSGVVASGLATMYGTLKTALVGVGVATKAAGAAAVAATGGLALLVGLLASVAIPKALGFLSGFSNETKIADNLARQFGGSVEEAESQISRFMATVGKSDPLAPFNKSIMEAEARLKELSKAAQESMMEAAKSSGGGWMAAWDRSNMLANAGELGMSKEDVDKLFPSKELTQKTTELRASIIKTFQNVKSEVYSTSIEVMAQTQQIQTALKAALADPANAASAGTLKEMYRVLATYAANYANTLDRINQDNVDKAMAERAQTWSTALKELGVNMAAFQTAYGDRFGQDYDTDSKAIDGTIKMYEKLWAASDEGKKQAAISKNAQIDNMEEILRLKKENLKAEVLIQTTQMRVLKAQTDERIVATTAQIENLYALGGAASDSAIIQAQAALLAANTTSQAAEKSIAAIESQIAAFEEQAAAFLKNKEAIRKQQDKENSKGIKKPREGAMAGQSVLDSIKNQAQQAADALEAVRSKHAELIQQQAGDTSAAKIERERGKLQADVNKMTTQQLKLLNDIDRMKAGPLRESALLEYNGLVATNAQIKAQLEENLKINEAIIIRQQLLTDLATRSENAKNQGDWFGSYQAQIDAINIKLQQQLSIEERISLEYQKRIIEMRQSNELFGLANEQMKQWVTSTRESYQDAFTNALPNAIDTTTNSFSELFSSVVAGTMTAKDAWSDFGQSMLDLGKSIIAMLIKVVIQMMIVKAMGSFLGLASGGAVGPTSAGAELGASLFPGENPEIAGALGDLQLGLADGGVLGRGGVTKFASGGVLDSPTVFGMAHGGLGVAGEAGPEAFVPLGRTREGKLGIETTGGAGVGGAGVTLINNNYFDFSGGGGQGGGDNAQLADMISGQIYDSLQQFVIQVLMTQMRPGGVLNSATA